MKRTFRAVISAFILICVLFTLGVSVLGAETIAGNKSVNGVAYKLSEDGKYYTAVGYSEYFPKLTIAYEIDGIPVTVISESAFQNNSHLTEIVIPDSVEVIEKSAFRFCENLVSVTLPSSLTYLPEDCFYDCSMLKNITLPSKLDGIGARCFYNCTMLGKLSIPASVTEIGYDVFHGCESIVLDVADNEYASAYASANNINTDFKSTTAYFMLMMLIGIAVVSVLFLIIAFFMKKHIKKHPTHNPGIYIERFFINIGKVFSFIGDKLNLLKTVIAKKLTSFINTLGKKTSERRIRKAQEKEKRKENKNGE